MIPEDNLRAELEERLRFETLLADLSANFVNLPNPEVDREIVEAQRRLCELLGLDLSALWQWSDETPGTFVLTHLYSTVEGPQSPGRRNQDQYPWAAQELLAGRMIRISSLEQMPAEASRDRESLSQLHIKSNLTLPLSVGGGQPFGILGLNTTRAERNWPDSMVKRLQLVAQIFANALARKRADQALRESEERMTLAADAAELGVLGWNIVRNQVWGSERWLRLFGFASGDPIRFESVIQRIHPDDRDTVECEVRRTLADRSEFAGEFRVVQTDGTGRWIASRGRGYPDANGTTARMLGVAVDITERKRTEETLRASQALLEAGADLAGLGCYEVDFAERRCFIDQRFHEICGVPAGRQAGLRPVELWMEQIHPDDRQRVLAERDQLHGGGLERLSIQYRYLHPTQGEKWLHHSARVAARDAAGHTIRSYGAVRDITTPKQAEEALLKSYAEIERLRDRLQAESDYLKAEVKVTQAHGEVIGKSPAIRKVLSQAEQVAPTDSSVLISGETGTGKELIAQTIHRLSSRRSQILVKVNCAALPAGLVESELFGREKPVSASPTCPP